MLHHKKLAFLLGIFTAVVILFADLALSKITFILWPAMIGLMGLGGQIEGIADYLYVAFLVVLNGLLYLLAFNFLTVLYWLIKR